VAGYGCVGVVVRINEGEIVVFGDGPADKFGDWWVVLEAGLVALPTVRVSNW